MIQAHDPAEAQAFRKQHATQSLGFVPTMGFLHEGHLSLVRRAKAENDLVAASIFVNPTQFNNPSDLANYPTNLERDLAMLQGEGVDLVFLPSREGMYPAGFATKVLVSGLTQELEGAFRPGHFDGVTQVVSKLFHIVGPDRAYFGMKDYQQLKVIQKMTLDLNFPIEIIPCPTFREADGLAMSSRNVRLTPEQRAQAPILYQALQWAQEHGSRQASPADLLQAMNQHIAQAPLAKVEYIALNHAQTLAPASELKGELLCSMAVFFGEVRLIDNCLLNFP